MEEVFLVIDTGSSSMRGILFDIYGDILFKYQIHYQMIVEGIKATQNVDDFSCALKQIVKKCVLYEKNNNVEIKSICFTSQRSSLVVLDEKNETFIPAIMWYDKRSSKICEEINKTYGKNLIRVSGILTDPVLLAPKIKYFQENYEEADKAAHYMSIQDYLIWITSGEFVTDQTLGSRTGIMDIQKKEWSDELLHIYRIDRKKLCKIVPCGSVVGIVSESFFIETGLKAGIPVITAGGDQQCSVVGQMLNREKEIALTLGSGGYASMVVSDIPKIEPERHAFVVASTWENKYNIEFGVGKVGTLFNWCIRQYPELHGKPEKFLKLASESSPRGDGIKFEYEWLEHCMLNDMSLIRANDTADEIQALLECIMNKVSKSFFELCECSGESKDICVAGGMAKSDYVCQMLADMTCAPVRRCHEIETTALGAWVQSILALKEGMEGQTIIEKYKKENVYQNSDLFLPIRKETSITNIK